MYITVYVLYYRICKVRFCLNQLAGFTAALFTVFCCKKLQQQQQQQKCYSADMVSELREERSTCKM